MILALFGTLLALAILLVWLGYYSKESTYSIIGCVFIFLLGSVVLIPGQLQTEAGLNKTTTYTYDANSTLTGTATAEVKTYSYFSDTTSRFFGVWLCMVALAGFIASLGELGSFWRPPE